MGGIIEPTSIVALLAMQGSAGFLSAALIEVLRNSKYLKDLDKQLIEKLSEKQGEILNTEDMYTELTTRYRSNKLVLVLGSGVSADYGLPTWNELLQNLLISAVKEETNESDDKAMVLTKLFTKVFPLNSLIAGRFLDLYYENTSAQRSFEEEIRRALYKNLNVNIESDLIKEIVQLCVAPGNSPNLDSIITYNYDDIIENAIEKLNIDVPYKTVFTVGQNISSNELPIYHVHGYLPREGELEISHKITLGENIYHQQYSDIYSWNNIVQINKFRDNTCLFIGTSFNDPNLRRLLDISNIQKGHSTKFNYVIKKRYDKESIKRLLANILEQNKELLDEKMNSSLGLEQVVKYLVNIIEKFEEYDAKSFGVRVIWVDRYSDIPGVLRRIRIAARRMR